MQEFRSAVSDDLSRFINQNVKFNEDLSKKVLTNEDLIKLKKNIIILVEQFSTSGKDFPILIEQLEELKKQNERLENENFELKFNKVECESNLREMTEKNKNLNKEMSKLSEFRDRLLGSLKDDEEKEELFKSLMHKTELEIQVNDLSLKLNNFIKDNKKLTIQLRECKNEISKLKDKLEKEKEDYEAQEKKLEKQIIEKNQLKLKNIELEKEKEELEDENIDLNIENGNIKRDIELKNAELEELKEKGEIKKEGKTVTVLKSQIDTLEDELKDTINNKETLKDQNDEKESVIKYKDNEILELRDKYDKVITELSKEKEDSDDLEYKLEESQKQLDDLKTQIKVIKEPKQVVKPEDQYIADGPIKESSCEQFKRCDIISGKTPLLTSEYLSQALPNRIDLLINNPDANLVNIHIILDDGVSPKAEIPTFVKYEIKVKDEYKPIKTKNVSLSISPTKRKTYFDFNGVNIDMYININEFEPLEATKMNKGSIIKIRTFHEVNEEIIVKEDEESFIISKWSEEQSLPINKSSIKDIKAIITKGATLNKDKDVINFAFKSPLKENTSTISIKLYEGDSVINICDDGLGNILGSLLLENGISSEVNFEINIHSYEENNDSYSDDITNVIHSPEEEKNIKKDLTIDIYLCKNSGITEFTSNTKLFTITIEGISEKGSLFLAELEITTEPKRKVLPSHIMSRFAINSNNNNLLSF